MEKSLGKKSRHPKPNRVLCCDLKAFIITARRELPNISTDVIFDHILHISLKTLILSKNIR